MPAFDWLKRLAGVPLAPRAASDPMSILAIMPFDADRRAIAAIAAQACWNLTLTSTCEDAVELLAQRRFGVILCDRDLAGFDWRDALEILAANAPASCIVLSSPVSDDYLWEEVVQRGGYDVIAKPLHEEQVCHIVNSAWLCWKTGWSQVSSKRQSRPKK